MSIKFKKQFLTLVDLFSDLLLTLSASYVDARLDASSILTILNINYLLPLLAGVFEIVKVNFPLVDPEGFEPSTFSLQGRSSPTEIRAHADRCFYTGYCGQYPVHAQ